MLAIGGTLPAFELPLNSGKLIYCNSSRYKKQMVTAIPKRAAAVLLSQKVAISLSGIRQVSVEITPKDGIFFSDNFLFMIKAGQKKFVYKPTGKIIKLENGRKIRLRFRIKANVPTTAREFRFYFHQRGALDGKQVQFRLDRITFERAKEPTEYVESIPLEKRDRIFPRTLIYPRIQSKYSLIQNYLDSYCRIIFTDRPLFFDRSLAGKHTGEYNKLNVPNGLVKQYKSALEFTDGLGLLCHLPSGYSRTMHAIDYASRAKLKNVILMELSLSPLQAKHEDKLFKLINRSLASSAVLKIGGKLLISSYWGEKYSPEAWQTIVSKLRKRFPDKLLFMVEMRKTCYMLAHQYSRNGNKITKTDIENAKQKIRSYLDVADGVNFSGSNHIISYLTKKGFPAHTFNEKAYSNIIVPILVSVLNEPKYRGEKLLGLSAHKTYFYRVYLENSTDEEGTQALRKSLKIALSANPDYIVMPEWNEINENTHIEPTVADSRTNIRIVNALTGRDMPEKSRKLPNFILSFRQDNSIGDPLPVEYLALPDPKESTRTYSVQLRLLDQTGKMVHKFPTAQFNQQKIADRFFLQASEKFAAFRYLTAELTITENGKKTVITAGLPHVRFTSPPNYNLKYVKIPLRDLPTPATIQIIWKNKGGKIIAKGQGKTNSPINTIELLANDIPLAAVDPRHEYNPPPGQNLLRFYRFVPTSQGSKFAGERYTIQAIHGEITARKTHQIALSGMAAPTQRGKILSGVFGGGAFSREIWFYASPDAVLKISCGHQTVVVKVAELLINGIYRKTLEHGVNWGLEPVRELPEVPFPLAKKSFNFNLNAIVSDQENPVYTVRILTRDGKVYRSLPFYPTKTSKKLITMPIYDRLTRHAVKVKFPENLTRKVSYFFTSKAGDILLSSPPSRKYHTLLGGYSYWMHTNLKKDTLNEITAPRWRFDDQKCILDFSPGAYLLMPPPLFSRAGFTLKMELKLKNVRKQHLLNIIGDSFSVIVKNGSLCVFLKTNMGTFKFQTPKKVKPEVWHSLILSYDLAQLRIWLDKKLLGEYPVSGIWVKGSALLFGGNSKNSFTGSLRALQITNYPESP